MSKFDDTARLARMSLWAREIESEVRDALLDHYIFWEVQGIIRANQELANARSHFFQWLGDTFVASAASAVRRQIDRHEDSVCLRRLLQEAIDYAPIVTREHYLSLCGSPPAGHFLREINDRAFDKWAEASGHHIDPVQVELDLKNLLDTCERIRHYVNKRVAHYNKSGVCAKYDADLPRS